MSWEKVHIAPLRKCILTVSRPDECDGDINELDDDVDVVANDQVDDRRHVKREQAVAEQTD